MTNGARRLLLLPKLGGLTSGRIGMRNKSYNFRRYPEIWPNHNGNMLYKCSVCGRDYLEHPAEYGYNRPAYNKDCPYKFIDN